MFIVINVTMIIVINVTMINVSNVTMIILTMLIVINVVMIIHIASTLNAWNYAHAWQLSDTCLYLTNLTQNKSGSLGVYPKLLPHILNLGASWKKWLSAELTVQNTSTKGAIIPQKLELWPVIDVVWSYLLLALLSPVLRNADKLHQHFQYIVFLTNYHSNDHSSLDSISGTILTSSHLQDKQNWRMVLVD